MSDYASSGDDNARPSPQARKGEGKMDKKEMQSIMQGLIDDAETLVDGELSPARVKAADYYWGRPFGNESEGRSQVVVTELRDTVHGMLPSLLRLFFGPERVVEFVPRTEQNVAMAQQATDYVQYVFAEDNKGFLKTYNVLKDGLVKKLGIFKWYWEEKSTATRDEGISQEQLIDIASRDDVELTDFEEGDKPGTFDVEYTIKHEGKPCIEALPPEEFIFNRGARDGDEAILLGHRTKKRRGDLIAMGYDEDVIDEHAGDGPTKLDTNVESVQRNLTTASRKTGNDSDAGDSNDEISYVEAYVYLDVDGDGENELRKICMIGDDHYIVHNVPTDERPFAIFCPIPEPHTLLGQSIADLTMDLQLTKSNILRATLDSLALSIFPRTVFLEQFVSVEDVLSTEIGAPIRAKRENAVQSISHQFGGDKSMPLLQYFDQISENRTGRNKGAMGLDADALQSSTQEAVGAAVQASQEQTEIIARIFAEQTLKPLFRGIYRMLVKYKPKARLARLRGSYVQIDTAAWDADMDVTVNVAIGTTMTEKRIAALQNISAKQAEILANLGPANPLVTMSQYRETLARIVELSGFKDTHSFFTAVPPDWQPAPPPPPPPSPEQILAQAQLQIEQMKTEKDLQIKQAELTLKQQQQEFDQELALAKLATDTTLKRYQIDAQFKAQFTQQDTEIDAAHEEVALEHAMSLAKMQHEHQMAEKEHDLEVQKHMHDREVAAQEQEMMRQQQTAAPETSE